MFFILFVGSDILTNNKGKPKCTFPFEYQKSVYAYCTYEGRYETPWCYTSGGSWGYCEFGMVLLFF